MNFELDVSLKNFPRCFTKEGTKNVCKWSLEYNNMESSIPYSANPA